MHKDLEFVKLYTIHQYHVAALTSRILLATPYFTAVLTSPPSPPHRSPLSLPSVPTVVPSYHRPLTTVLFYRPLPPYPLLPLSKNWRAVDFDGFVDGFDEFDNRCDESDKGFVRFNNEFDNARRAGNENLGVELYAGSLLPEGGDELGHDGYRWYKKHVSWNEMVRYVSHYFFG